MINEYHIKQLMCAYIQQKKDIIYDIFKNYENSNLRIDPTIEFDKAFIYATDLQFSKSFNLYSRLFKNGYNNNLIYEITEFFNYHIDHNIDYEANLFCRCVVFYFTKKFDLAMKDLELLSKAKSTSYKMLKTRMKL